VFVRTGYIARRNQMGASDPAKDGTPGPHPNVALWLKHHDVAMFGSDTRYKRWHLYCILWHVNSSDCIDSIATL
jgi:hypothetical protein